jgi:hypothetical protein
MVEPVVVTLFPVAFLAVLFAGGQQFRRRHIDMDGTAPISRRLFYSSKDLIVVLWMAMVLDAWGMDVSWFRATPLAATGWGTPKRDVRPQ